MTVTVTAVLLTCTYTHPALHTRCCTNPAPASLHLHDVVRLGLDHVVNLLHKAVCRLLHAVLQRLLGVLGEVVPAAPQHPTLVAAGGQERPAHSLHRPTNTTRHSLVQLLEDVLADVAHSHLAVLTHLGNLLGQLLAPLLKVM